QGQAASLTDDAVTLTMQPTSMPAQTGQNYAGSQNNSPYDTYTALGQSDNSTNVPPPALGTYDLNGTSALSITAAAMQGTIGSGSTTVNSTLLQYRVYPLGTADASKPSYTTINLTSSQTGSSAFSGTASTTIDLLNGLTSGGTYVLDARFALTLTRTLANGTSSTRTFYDLSGGAYFYATFYVTPPPTTPPGGTTTWQSTDTGPSGTRWFSAANWSNGIPTAASDVIIPENMAGSNIVFPILNTRSLNYAVRNLTLQGTTNSGRAQVTIQAAVLHVYGNISQLSGGLVGSVTDRRGVADSTANSTIILAGGNQFITGRLSVPDVIVAGSGVKSVANTLLPTNTISLRPRSIIDGVVVQTASAQTDSNGTTIYVFDTTGNSVVNLGSTGAINTTNGSNETITSYIKGVVLANGPLVSGSTQLFGNTGLELTPNHPATLVNIQRIIGDPLIGPTNSNNPRAVPIKRQYNIIGDDNSASTSTAGSTNTVVFHYLPSAFELNGINEDNLILYSTNTGSAPYTTLNGTLDKTARTVTQADVASTTNYFFTLGDITNPLPVTLVSFLAARTGANTQLTWVTASEQNNRGFEVQVSTDGTTFRTLAFVASQAGNSTQKQKYTYTDTEAGKTGTRYYRLHQLDLDGSNSYSPVRVVGFEGATLATEVSVYPNPVVGSEARLFIQTAETGTAHLRITDLMGRTLIDQVVTTANGSTEVSLTKLVGAQPGTYLARLTLPSGQVKNLKVQKQ
ncbi:MAG: T9SS type A sorting domain-containing protein, partial [Hymenobacter sp.]